MAGRDASGQSLDSFRQVKLLGEGSYSAVYKVVRLADEEIYALKKVKLPALSEKEKQNALNEIRLLASVRHENVISYKDAFFDDRSRCLCIVTECADQGDLLQRIVRAQKEHSHLPEPEIWRYLIGLCHGLQALHGMKILHRDLKSANVFLSTVNGAVIAKLGDFNVSTVAKRGLCMTQTGTPYYASPEVWRDMPYDSKSDQWSLGCVMYEAAALKPPFRAKDMDGLYRKVLRGQYHRIPSVFTQELSNVIGVLLQVNPQHRPSAEQLFQLPVMRRRAAELDMPGVGSREVSNLLNTIKVPRKLIDLSAYLPRPQYGDRKLENADGAESVGAQKDGIIKKGGDSLDAYLHQSHSDGGIQIAARRRRTQRGASAAQEEHESRAPSQHAQLLDVSSLRSRGRESRRHMANYARAQYELEAPAQPKSPVPGRKSPALDRSERTTPQSSLRLPRIASCPGQL